MLAVYKKELQSFYQNMLGYVFAAFLLVVSGIMTMSYCLGTTPQNTFEYTYGSMPFIYIIIIPILTMNSIAGEMRNKTDQMLYTSPVSIWKIVTAKYLAMCTVLLIPLALTLFYPVILMRYGNISMTTSASSMFAFFLLGCSLISIGMFISSLTDSQILSAVISFGVLFIIYTASQIQFYISRTSYASAVFFAVIGILIGLVVRKLTKSTLTGIASALIIFGGIIYLFLTNQKSLEGAASTAIGTFALFTKIENFIYGIFDINAVVYFISIIIFFNYLCIQSIDKRRWN